MENKVKYNQNRPGVNEVKQYQNFDTALNSAKMGSHAGAWAAKTWVIGGGITLIVAFGLWFGFQTPKENTDEKPTAMNQSTAIIKEDTLSKKKWTLCNISELPVHQYRFDDKKGMEINTPHGSKIHIPAGAFGTNDSVILKLKEIHRPDEVVLSGIPMNYAEGDEDFVMSTAGMLEIEARDMKGNELKSLKKAIQLAVKSDQSAPGCNFYQHNGQKWDFMHPAPAKNTTKEAEDRLESIAVEKPAKMELYEPQKLNTDQYAFSFDINSEAFPELALLQNPVFEVAEGQDFNPDHYHVNWESIRLEKENNRYVAVLQRGNTTVRYTVNPVLEAASYKKAKKEYDELMAKQVQAEKEYQQQLRNLSSFDQKENNAVMRFANITQTGVYNFDYIKRLNAYDNIDKEVIVKNHKEFHTLYAYFKDGNQNIIISDSYGKLPLSKSSNTYLIATDYNGNIHMAEVSPDMSKDQIVFKTVNKEVVLGILSKG